MPLDAKSLDLDRWQASARLRHPGEEAAAEDVLRHLSTLQKARVVATAERRDLRQAQQQHQQHQRRATSDDNNNNNNEIPVPLLDRQAIKLRLQCLQQAEENAQQAHARYLETLPNYVDEAVVTTTATSSRKAQAYQETTTTSLRKAATPAVVVLDDNPLYELALYQRWSENRVVWTTHGQQLQRAVLDYLTTCACCCVSSTEKAAASHTWELPATLPLSQKVLRRFGSGMDEEDGDASLLMDAPSWMALLEETLAQQSFTDKQLPVLHVLTGPIDVANKATSPEKELRLPAWYHALASDSYLTCVVVTGPSLVADSRRLQHEIAQQWQAILSALYKPDHPSSSSSSTRAIQIEAMPAPDLQAYESSRLVLRVGNPHNNHSDQHTTTYGRDDSRPLVSIANLESYGSRSLKHQATHEALHVLLVQVAPLSVLLDGLVRATSPPPSSTGHPPPETNQASTTWKIPTVLLAYTTVRAYPIVRRMVRNKKGRRTVQIVQRAVAFEKKTADLNATATTTIAADGAAPRATASRNRILSNGLSAPSRHEMQAEALTVPFDFFPFNK